VNRRSFDRDYFSRKLARLLRDIPRLQPDQLARELARLSRDADPQVLLLEAEFSPEELRKKTNART